MNPRRRIMLAKSLLYDLRLPIEDKCTPMCLGPSEFGIYTIWYIYPLIYTSSRVLWSPQSHLGLRFLWLDGSSKTSFLELASFISHQPSIAVIYRCRGEKCFMSIFCGFFFATSFCIFHRIVSLWFFLPPVFSFFWVLYVVSISLRLEDSFFKHSILFPFFLPRSYLFITPESSFGGCVFVSS